MACTGAHCTNHGTGTTTCVGHRPSCSTNNALSLSTDFATELKKIRASDVEQLRTKIRSELTAYNLHSTNSYTLLHPTTVVSDSDIDDQTANDLYEMTREVDGGTPILVGTANPVDEAFWDTIRDKYNVIRQDCICNSDCSCNNVCVCHNDCGCNYSDRRLKVEIVYC